MRRDDEAPSHPTVRPMFHHLQTALHDPFTRAMAWTSGGSGITLAVVDPQAPIAWKIAFLLAAVFGPMLAAAGKAFIEKGTKHAAYEAAIVAAKAEARALLEQLEARQN